MRPARDRAMSPARTRLFIALAHNASSQTEYLCLPEARTVTVSYQIDV